MDRRGKEFYDNIDVGNLFSQWHPDVRKFTLGKDKESILKLIKESKVGSFDTSKYSELLNLTNTDSCKAILERILKVKDVSNFLNILEERDSLHPRDITRGFSVKEIFELVKNNDYHPIFFLELNKKYYIIDGRTRFYCCLFLNVPAKIRKISDYDIRSRK